MSGTSKTTFAPERPLTRAMLATVLYRAAGEPKVTGNPSFLDTQAGQYYANAVVWANANNIITGYGNGLFGTNDPVTREQLATILWRYDGAAETQSASFPDASAISGYAVSAVAWAVNQGMMEPRTNGAFAPKENAVRAEVAAALYQYLTVVERTPVNNRISVSFNGHTYSAVLEDNDSAKAFAELLRNAGGSITVSASDYGSFEKVASLGVSLPSNNVQTTTDAGDFVLYANNQIVLFYGSNSWSYTRLGRLEGDLRELRSDLGSGDVSILSLIHI